MREEDFHPSHKVYDLLAVASSLLPELVDVVVMGMDDLLEGCEDCRGGLVVAALFDTMSRSLVGTLRHSNCMSIRNLSMGMVVRWLRLAMRVQRASGGRLVRYAIVERTVSEAGGTSSGDAACSWTRSATGVKAE